MATDEPKERKQRRTVREVWYAWREGLLLAASLLVSLAVAGVTGWGSWSHIVHIGHVVHEPAADWLPVAIDGMMVNGTVLAAIDRFRGRVARTWSVISLWSGSVLTLSFNVASAYERGFWAMMIAVMFAVALLFTVEAMFHPSQTLIEEAVARRAERRAAKAARKAGVTLAVPVVAPTVLPAVAPAPEPVAVIPVAEAAPEVAPEAPAEVVAEVTAEPAPKPNVRPRRKPRERVRAGRGMAGGVAGTDEEIEAAIVALGPQRGNVAAAFSDASLEPEPTVVG